MPHSRLTKVATAACLFAVSIFPAVCDDEFSVPEIKVPAKLKLLRKKFEKEASRLLRPLEIKYLAALRNLQDEYQKAGNLDAVLNIKGEADGLEEALKAAAASNTAAPTTKAATSRGRTINLAELVDIEEDGDPAKKWRMNGKLIECTEKHFVPKLYLPYIPPEEYDFRIQWAQPGLRHGIGHLMPNGDGGSFHCCAGENGGTLSDMHLEDGQEQYFKRHAEITLEPDKKYESIVKVRKDSIKYYVNGKLLFEYTGDKKDLTVSKWRRSKKPDQLAIFCDDPTLFSVVEVTEISGKGKILRN